MNEKGILIVIEGTDGSGKATQTKIIKETLRSQGHKIASFEFPQYGKPSARWVEKYLNNELGEADAIDPYLASIFFALDRRDNVSELNNLLAQNEIVILNRYVDSNAGHQGGKIKNVEKRKNFLDWLYYTEHTSFGAPKPDLIIILHVPAEVAQKYIIKKSDREYITKGTHDAHEGNIEHLKNAEAVYLWLADQHPENHEVISCC